MSVKKKLPLILIGVFLGIFLLCAVILGSITVTAYTYGYYKVGSRAVIVAQNDLMQGSREGCFEKGDLVSFEIISPDKIDTLRQNTVILYKDGDGLNVKRIYKIEISPEYDLEKVYYLKTDAVDNAPQTILSPSDLIGTYRYKSSALGNLFAFSTEISGLVTIYILPSLLILVYCVILFSMLKKERAASNKR